MAKQNKYGPNYGLLYPGVEITPEVLKVLKQSDRKMRYLEKDIKCGVFRIDPVTKKAAFAPSREDSLDRLLDEEQIEFASAEPTPEDSVVHNDEIDRLHKALKKLKPQEYALIYEVFYEESTEEILANREGITQQGISWRLHRILAKIKKLMED